MIDRLLKLEEQGWAALSSAEPVQFCDECLADEAAMVVPGMVYRPCDIPRSGGA